jgi:hypothetical protein
MSTVGGDIGDGIHVDISFDHASYGIWIAILGVNNQLITLVG